MSEDVGLTDDLGVPIVTDDETFYRDCCHNLPVTAIPCPETSCALLNWFRTELPFRGAEDGVILSIDCTVFGKHSRSALTLDQAALYYNTIYKRASPKSYLMKGVAHYYDHRVAHALHAVAPSEATRARWEKVEKFARVPGEQPISLRQAIIKYKIQKREEQKKKEAREAAEHATKQMELENKVSVAADLPFPRVPSAAGAAGQPAAKSRHVTENMTDDEFLAYLST
jgi:hypothetical protein